MHTNKQTTSWFDCDFRWCGDFQLFLLNFPPQIYVNYAFTTHAGKVLRKLESSEVIFLFHFFYFGVFANSRYLRRFLVRDSGFLRLILAGARRHRLVIRPRRCSSGRFNRTGQRGLDRHPQSVVGADPVGLVRFEIPPEFREYAPLSVAGEQVGGVGAIGGECPTCVAGELIRGWIGGCSVLVFHSWIARANSTVRRRTRDLRWRKLELNPAKLK